MASGKPKKKNPRLASGRKRVRQDVKINAANTSLRSKYRTAVKNVEKAVVAGDKTKATELFAKMQAVVDTGKQPGLNLQTAVCNGCAVSKEKQKPALERVFCFKPAVDAPATNKPQRFVNRCHAQSSSQSSTPWALLRANRCAR